MRNKRETDISQYKDIQPELNPAVHKANPVKRFFKAIGKFIFTVFSVCFVAGVIAVISLGIYIASLASEPTGIDLRAKSLKQTSFIMVQNADGNYEQ